MSDMLSFDVHEVELMVGVLDRMGKKPQKAVTKAASKGTTVVRRSVRGTVPVGETGNLKKGIIRKGERSRLKGKKVYDLTLDRRMNAIFQKPVKNPGEAGSKATLGGHAYYPASMEYGFLTRSKGGGVDYVPGYEFMKKGTEAAAPEAERVIIDTAMKELIEEWKRD